MRIEQLEYLTAVTRLGSLRRASEHLHISQPALSEAIRNLERELGVSLLDRHRSGSRISGEGQLLLPHMAEVLDAVAQLRAAAGQHRLAGRVVRVGTVNAGTSALLVPAIRLFAASQPNVTVDVANILQADIHRRLTEGTLDAGLVNVLPGDQVPASLHATVLLRGRPAVVCRTDHPFAGQPVVTVDQLREHPFVAMREGYLMHGYTQRLFAARFPRESVATDGAENAKYLVAAGAGATVLPDYSVTDDPLHEAGVLTVRPLAGVETTITMLLLRREHTRVPAAVRGFEQVIGALAAQHPQAARAD